MKEKPNLNYIEDLASGSEDFKQKLISVVKREFPEEKNEFLVNYNASRFHLAAENVHKLKHKIGMMGYEKGYQTAIDFEEELLQQKHSLYSDFMKIMDSIEEFLKTL